MASVKSGSSSNGSSGGSSGGGLKGFLQRTGRFCYDTSMDVLIYGKMGMKYGYTLLGHTSFAIASTSMIVLMPLLFEIARETQMLETERSLVKDLKNRGYTDRQLQEMGFCENALHTPSVAAAASIK